MDLTSAWHLPSSDSRTLRLLLSPAAESDFRRKLVDGAADRGLAAELHQVEIDGAASATELDE